MSAAKKISMPKVLDLPLLIAGALTFVFYWVVGQESMHGTLLHRYTTEHTVEYVIVAFFIWGLCDALFHVISFPPEFMALKQDCLPRRNGKESVAQAAALSAYFQKKPLWLQKSRLGHRLTDALAHLQEKGTADGFADYLHHLSDQDFEKTSTNYGLIRFICWVTPMFGFLGTVVHFGTALSGQTAGEIGDKLPTVVAEMGTAFNTTTVALTAATTMMFSLFLCERTERGIVAAVDQRTERELLTRFETHDASVAPFINAMDAASQSTLHAIDERIDRQFEVWSKGLELLQRQTEAHQKWQTEVWVEALEKLEMRFEANDVEREKRLARVLEALDVRRQEQRKEIVGTVDQVAGLKNDFGQLIGQISSIVTGQRDLIGSQTVLAENLRLLRETQQLDQAFHGLTAAIHMLTARAPSSLKEHRAA